MRVKWENSDVQEDLRKCNMGIVTQEDLRKKYQVSKRTMVTQMGIFRRQQQDRIREERMEHDGETDEPTEPDVDIKVTLKKQQPVYPRKAGIHFRSTFTSGLKTRHLHDRLLLVRESTNHNYKFSRAFKPNVDEVWTFTCNGCNFAKYGDRKAAKKAGRAEIPIKEGPTKYLKVFEDKVVGQVGNHHPQCRPLTDIEVAVQHLKRKEIELVENEGYTPRKAFLHTLYHNIAATATEYGLTIHELKLNYQCYSVRRNTLNKRKRRKVPKYLDPFKRAVYNIKPDNINWFCDSDELMGILLLASLEDIEYLKRTISWIIDATFDMVPDGFSQMLVIHAKIGQNYGPVVHVLMKRRTAADYDRIFEMLTNAAQETLRPETIITDFEKPMRSSIKTWFPATTTKLYGCMFHHSKAVIKNVSRFGLQPLYNKNTAFKEWVGEMVALKLLPWKYAKKVYDRRLKNGPPISDEDERRNSEAIRSFIHYFGRTWMEPDDKYDTFETWGHHSNEGPRTTNVAEGYHSRLNRIDMPKHPSFPVWMDRMLEEHSLNSHANLRHLHGFDTIKQSPIYVRVDRKVVNAKNCLTYRIVQLARTTDDQLEQLWHDIGQSQTEPLHRNTVHYVIWHAYRRFGENVSRENMRANIEDEILRRQLVHIAYLLAYPSGVKKERRQRPPTPRKQTRRPQRSFPKKKTSQASPPSAPKPSATATTAHHTPTQSPTPDLSQPDFIKWGAPGFDNTCTVECLLESIIYHMTEVPEWINTLPIGNDNDEFGKRDKEFRQMVLLFQQRKPIEAKLFILDKLANDPDQNLKRSETGTIDLVGNERDRLIKRYKYVWTRSEESFCTYGKCPKRKKNTILPELILQREEKGVQGQLNYLFRHHDKGEWESPTCGARYESEPEDGAPITESGQIKTCAGKQSRSAMLWERRERTAEDDLYFPWMLPFEITNFGNMNKCLGLLIDEEGRPVEGLPLKISHIGHNDVYRLVAITMCNDTQQSDIVGHITALIRTEGNFLLYDGLNSKMEPYQRKDIENKTPQFAYYFRLPHSSRGYGGASPAIGSPRRPEWMSPSPTSPHSFDDGMNQRDDGDL